MSKKTNDDDEKTDEVKVTKEEKKPQPKKEKSGGQVLVTNRTNQKQSFSFTFRNKLRIENLQPKGVLTLPYFDGAREQFSVYTDKRILKLEITK